MSKERMDLSIGSMGEASSTDHIRQGGHTELVTIAIVLNRVCNSWQ